MKKRLFSLLAAVLLLGSLFCLPAAAAGSLSASASAASVTVGSSVTVTLQYSGGGDGIGSIDASFHYNAAAFQYVSCSGASASGSAGELRISWYATDVQAPGSVSLSLTFKAIAAGSGDFSVSTSELINDNNVSLGTPSATVAVSANNPTLSGNANLASLKPSSGTLTPQFNANTTSYTIAVPYTTTSLSLSAKAAVSGAKVQVGGTNTLKVGKNTQTITVTAPNGTQKTYTVVITRAADQGQNSNSSGATTTAPATPADDALQVEVDGKELTVADTQPDVALPDGFVWDSADFGGMQVAAAKNEKSGLTLLYLRDPETAQGALYLYDAENKSFAPFRPLTVAGGVYTLLDIPADMAAPAGTVAGEVTIGEQTVPAWLYEDTAQADFSVVYATAPDGRTGLYVYDSTDGSMQRYRATTLPADTALEQPTGNALTRFFTAYRTPILLGAAVLAGAALLVVAIVLLVMLLRKPDDCKH